MRTLFLDVDSQLDFLYPAGALYVPGAEHVVDAIAALNRHAVAHGIPLLSTADAHTENDPEFKLWPAHCVAGTLGQRKPAETLVGQPVIGKQTIDCFQSPAVIAAIEAINADKFVVYGVVTEICVLNAARGLKRYGKPIEIVADAVKELSSEAANKMKEEFNFVEMSACMP